MNKVDLLSCCVTKIEMYCGEQTVGSASGFFWKHKGNIYLVTNWHVFSGRNTVSGQPIDLKKGAVPDKIRIVIPSKQESEISWTSQKIELEIDGVSLWLQHPIHGQDVDVAVILIKSELNIISLGTDIQWTPLWTPVATEVFIIGYPDGIFHDEYLPIWKRGSIATDYYAGMDKQTFLVDCSGRKGLSGAPVFALSHGHYISEDEGNGRKTIYGPGPYRKFMSIYSGRLGSQDNESFQLGKIWRAALIVEIIEGNISGNYSLR